MVRYIAHRGNTQGPKPELENTDFYLRDAYVSHDVEIDLIGHKGILYLGHDRPQSIADTGFIQRTGVWCHAKNHEAAVLLSTMRCNWFWHQEDDFTLTSNGFIWCYPGVYIDHPRAIWLNFDGAQMPDSTNIYGICGDKIDEDINLRTSGQR